MVYNHGQNTLAATFRAPATAHSYTYKVNFSSLLPAVALRHNSPLLRSC